MHFSFEVTIVNKTADDVIHVYKARPMLPDLAKIWLKSSKMTNKLDKIEILAVISEKWKSHFMWTKNVWKCWGGQPIFRWLSEWNAKVNS